MTAILASRHHRQSDVFVLVGTRAGSECEGRPTSMLSGRLSVKSGRSAVEGAP